MKIFTMKGGLIVETKDGKVGRTFYNKGIVNNKVPVYLEQDGGRSYAETAILCDPKNLKQIGFID